MLDASQSDFYLRTWALPASKFVPYSAASPERIMRCCDIHGRPIEPQKDTRPKQFFVVVDSSRALTGTSGPVRSNHSSWSAVFKASKKNGHYRAMEVKHAMEIGHHVNPLVHMIPSTTARFG
jgi:hypothetical protein